MEACVSTWGNSLGLRIPKSIAELMGIGEGSKVLIELKNGKLIISPVAQSVLKQLAKDIDLSAMVKKVTFRNKPDQSFREDKPSGKEVW